MILPGSTTTFQFQHMIGAELYTGKDQVSNSFVILRRCSLASIVLCRGLGYMLSTQLAIRLQS